MTIKITENWGATRLQIWKDGAEAGHIEKGRVYVQGVAPADLAEIGAAIMEYEARKGKK